MAWRQGLNEHNERRQRGPSFLCRWLGFCTSRKLERAVALIRQADEPKGSFDNLLRRQNLKAGVGLVQLIT